MVKNAFFCVTKAKLDHPVDPFFLVLLGTDRLETLFGILRTMVGNDANLDILQLALHVTATTEVSNILAKHPEWDKSPRRLRLPTVTKSMDIVSNSTDHIGPRAYLHPETLPIGVNVGNTVEARAATCRRKIPLGCAHSPPHFHNSECNHTGAVWDESRYRTSHRRGRHK